MSLSFAKKNNFNTVEIPVDSAPIGAIDAFGGATAPTGWMLCDGSAISRTTYSELFTAIGTGYGVGDGSTTFNLPNGQGVFLRGAGSQTINTRSKGGGSLGDVNEDQMQGHRHGVVTFANTAAPLVGGGQIQGYANYNTGAYNSVGDPTTDGVNGTPRTGLTSEPSSIDVNYIIKVFEVTKQVVLISNEVLNPTGTMQMFCGASGLVPDGWILCDGSAVSRNTYANLFGLVGTTYGVGDGSTTFNVPNMQGVFARGVGSQTINARSKGGGSLGDVNEDHGQGHQHNIIWSSPGEGTAGAVSTWPAYGIINNIVKSHSNDGVNGTPRMGTTTEPSSVDVHYIIKY